MQHRIHIYYGRVPHDVNAQKISVDLPTIPEDERLLSVEGFHFEGHEWLRIFTTDREYTDAS